MKEIIIENFIKDALIEDMPYGDITTENLIDDKETSEAYLLAKEDGIIAGLNIFSKVFKFIDNNLTITHKFNDGDIIKKGNIISLISGKTKSILIGERLALNILQRMSGIATLTNQFVSDVKEYNCKIVDTRKTTPNFRFFEKLAVKLGGGYNHRFNLSDAVMIKDNHIVACKGIKNAVDKIIKVIPHTTKIEVEVENIEMLKDALNSSCDIIMLDNMSCDLMREAVKINNGKKLLEASGNMTLDRIKEVAKTGVDVISVGALTHSYKALDISLKLKRNK